ncbi:MAG: deoxynucleoside kinase [Gammaproteobacteria bacterium]|nr:deoxynucleoside kinase [Gammaproteobacteria bacterium]
MQSSHPQYIVVEGPIGVGKTSLAHRLAQSFGSELLLEGPEDNPFIDRFYENPRTAALPTQLFFLTQRVRQMQELRQGDMFNPVRVADFLIEKDRLFAELTLDDDELRLYDQIYNNMAIEAPVPDLVIYLQAPVEVLLERIARRNRSYERAIDSGYLQRLVDAYARFFHDYYGAPLLIVNAAEIDLVKNDHDYTSLLEQVKSTPRGRHFFNPLPLELS